MSKILYPRKHIPHKVFFTWQMTYHCNYKCTYCNAKKHGNEGVADTVYLSAKKWIKVWDKIYDMYGECEINISGGEPTIYPEFLKLIQGLTKRHKIEIITNLSCDVAEFVKVLDTQRVRFACSLHPEHIDIEEFIEKIMKLEKKGFKVHANLVLWPPFLDRVEEIKARFEKEAIDLVLYPFVGEYKNIQYPINYSKEQKSELKLKEEEVSSKKAVEFSTTEESVKTETLCRMGENYGFIQPNGDVERCCKDHSIKLGNIIEGTFKLLDTAKPCASEKCNCWKCMVIDKEKDWIEHWGWKEHFGLIVYMIKIEKYIKMFSDGVINKKEYFAGLNIWVQQIVELSLTDEKSQESLVFIEEKIVDEGNVKFKDQKYEEAKNIGLEIIKEMPDNYEAYMLVGLSNMMMLKYDEAEKYFLQGISLDGTRTKGYLLIGDLELKRQNYQKSEEWFQKALLTGKTKKQTSEICIEILRQSMDNIHLNGLNKENLKSINKWIKKIKKYDKNNKSAAIIIEDLIHVKAGYKYIEDRKYEEAKNIGLEIIKEMPDNYEAYMLVGLSNMMMLKYDEAEKYFLRGISLDGTRAKGYLLAGKLELKRENRKKSEKWFQKALKKGKEDDKGKSVVYCNIADYKISSIYNIVIEDKQIFSDIEYLIKMAEKYDDSNSMIKNTLDQYYCSKARNLLKLSKLHKIGVKRAYEEVKGITNLMSNIELKSKEINEIKNDIFCVELLDGYEYINNDLFDEAKQFAQQFINKYQNDMSEDTFFHINIYMARIYLKLKQFNEVKQYLFLAKDKKPNNPSTYKLLAMVEFELGNYKESKSLFIKSLKFAKHSNNKNEISEIYYEMALCVEKYIRTKKELLDKYDNGKILKILSRSVLFDKNNQPTIDKIKMISDDIN